MSQQEDPECVEAPPRTPTHALRYSHSHGTDISVWPSYQDALVGACQIIVSWWDEVEDDDVQCTLRKLFASEEWEEALSVWGTYQAECGSGEEMEVLTLTFETPRPFTMPPEEDSE